jgi:hypothetical protein
MKTKAIVATALLTAAGAALAHPGHADQSIHLAEWLMGAGVLVGSVLVLRSLLLKRKNNDRKRSRQSNIR